MSLGYVISDTDGSSTPIKGKCPLFWNYDPEGTAQPRMRTLLIDSLQLKSVKR